MPDQAQPDRLAPARWSAWRDALPHVVTLAAFAAFTFLSGGYILTRAAPVAVAWLLAAAIWVWFLRMRRRPSRLYVAAMIALGAYTCWAGLSVLWSFGPDLSWVAFDYAALYLAIAALLGVTATGRLQLRVAGYGFLAVAVAAGCYSFAGKVLPEVVTHAHEYARLDSPIGYWNVLALLMVMALPVALSLAARRDAALGLRALAVGAAVPLAFTFVFAFSRGGVVALVVALVGYFALTDRRLPSFAAMVALVTPVALAMWQVRDLDTLFAATNDAALRTLQGHTMLRWSVVALVAAVLLQVAAVLVERAIDWPGRVKTVAGAAVLVGLVLGIGGGSAVYVQKQGGTEWLRARYDAFVADSDTRGTENSAGRLLSLNTGRPPLWRQALEQYEAGPKYGTGAGTYRFTHLRFRKTLGVTKHAHSQWLNALSELGIPGLVSIAAAMALLLAATLRGLRRGRRDSERALLAAIQAGLMGFIVHMSWDWDWDMGAAGAALFLLAATAAAYITHRDGPPWQPRTNAVPIRVLACGLLVLVSLSWLPPYLGAVAQNRAVERAGAGDVTAALASARDAARWDPLAVDPLITVALVEQQLGQNRQALDTLRSARALQPQNYRVHYQLGLLLARAYARRDEAAASFRRALELNPLDESSAYELKALAGGQ
jgi:O-Antigen ligase